VPDVGTLGLFAAASLALIVVPGPSVGFILATTLRHGRRAGLAATAGVETGYGVHVLAAVAGVSAVVAASATAFSVVKVAGAAWLLWLAARAWRARTPGTLADAAAAEPARDGRHRPFRSGLLVGALNPKTALFYLAFLPQFVRPDAGPAPAQLLVLGLLFVALAWVVDSLWALGGDVLRRGLPRVRLRVLDRLSAAVYAALAAVTLTARRAG
jgi:threonine/homoserine/homoserine lactone efflux protein